jgi:hypothetical protein
MRIEVIGNTRYFIPENEQEELLNKNIDVGDDKILQFCFNAKEFEEELSNSRQD